MTNLIVDPNYITPNNLFGMTQQLMNIAKTTAKTISRKKYDKFCNEYIFQAIKGESFGIAFCKKFNMIDYILLLSKNTNDAQRYISTTQYIRNAPRKK